MNVAPRKRLWGVLGIRWFFDDGCKRAGNRHKSESVAPCPLSGHAALTMPIMAPLADLIEYNAGGEGEESVGEMMPLQRWER